jgi:hypothetical protein
MCFMMESVLVMININFLTMCHAGNELSANRMLHLITPSSLSLLLPTTKQLLIPTQ